MAYFFFVLEKRATQRSVSAEGDSLSTYRTALSYLPLCLSKSSPSKELAKLLEGLELPPAGYDEDPVKKEEVLEAINAYISVHLLYFLF